MSARAGSDAAKGSESSTRYHFANLCLMNPMPRHSVLLLGLLFSGACYHATIETGAAPTAQVIEKEWAPSWLYGLVPPDPVETAAKCPTGVSKVETQHSFLNMVANVLTFGIYTPMTITVTCGTGRRAALPTVHGSADVAASVAEAAALSYTGDTAVQLELPR
jgi:hypothetical protein